MREQIYQLVFEQGFYSRVDFEGTLEQCQEVKYELQSQMHMSGETNFYYIIRKKQH